MLPNRQQELLPLPPSFEESVTRLVAPSVRLCGSLVTSSLVPEGVPAAGVPADGVPPPNGVTEMMEQTFMCQFVSQENYK